MVWYTSIFAIEGEVSAFRPMGIDVIKIRIHLNRLILVDIFMNYLF